MKGGYGDFTIVQTGKKGLTANNDNEDMFAHVRRTSKEFE